MGVASRHNSSYTHQVGQRHSLGVTELHLAGSRLQSMLTLILTLTADNGGRTLMSEIHTTHHDTPKLLSWARSGAVATTQNGFIMASLAWVRIPLWDSFRKKVDLTLTLTLAGSRLQSMQNKLQE